MGKYTWLQLPFGLSVSSDIFHERLDMVIKVVPEVTGIADDVLAKGDDEISHDVAVCSLLETVPSNNLKSTQTRYSLRCRSVNSLSISTHPRRHEHQPKESQCHQKIDAPQCKKELESFQGMVN